jgi:2-methylcitrate dehydratase PrpD
LEDKSGKGFLMGIGCGNGILAADLAGAGLTGLTDIVGAWMPLIVEPHDPAKLVNGLGQRYEFDFLLFKYFATVGPLFAPLEAVFSLLHEVEIHPEGIERIHVEGYRRTLMFHRDGPPLTPEGARANLAYCLATALVTRDRASLIREAFTPQALRDPMRLQLAARVSATVNESYDLLYPREAAKSCVRISLRDGRVLEREIDRDQITRYHHPTREDLQAKFRTASSSFLDAHTANEVAELVWNLEAVSDIRALTAVIQRAVAS